MMDGERVEIRPNVVRNVVLLMVGSLAFAAGGAWMVIGQSRRCSTSTSRSATADVTTVHDRPR